MNMGSSNGGGSVSRGFNHLLNHLKKEGFVKKSISVHGAVRVWAVLLGMLATTSVARADVFYVADAGQLAKISPDGVTTVLIKEPDKGLHNPTSIAIDNTGNLYLSNNNTVEITKVTPNGDVGVFINTNIKVNGVATDRFNNVYLAETLGNTILKVTPSGVPTVLTDQVNRPAALAVDATGNIFSSNWDNTVTKITPGGLVTTIATGINGHFGVALNGDGNVYVSDLVDSSILRIAPDGSIATFASGLQSPRGIVFGSNGDLYVLNSTTVSEITPNGIVTPFASGLLNPLGIVAQAVPEPSTMIILSGLGIGLLRRSR